MLRAGCGYDIKNSAEDIEIIICRLHFLLDDDVVFFKRMFSLRSCSWIMGFAVMDIKIEVLVILLFTVASLCQDVNKEGIVCTILVVRN